jgi:uncharacterized membrane protein YfcA
VILSDYWSLLMLALAGIFAGSINAVAGGGSLISFPILIAIGIPAVPANITNAVALWPGSLASLWGYRNEAKGTLKITFLLTVPAVLGALLGAWALLHTSEALFRRVVPALILLATILLWQQQRIKELFARGQSARHLGFAIALQILVSIYGGYFGAGMGIMMLAVLGLSMEGDIHKLNAVKTWLATIINIVASIFFLASNRIVLRPGLALCLGAIAGGYWGARLAMKVQPDYVRRFIILIGIALTIFFAWRFA